MKIIYNDKILSALSWFMKIGGITLYPFIILRKKYKWHYTGAKILRHEKIHIEQQKELLVVLFYLWYITEFTVRLFKKDAYKNISFEREAKANESNLDYLKNRKRFSFLKYI